MTNTNNDNIDASAYELLVRRVFNCDRCDSRYPFADANAWVTLINKWNFANDPTRSKNSLNQRIKEYEIYFKTMAGYFDKTIEHVLRKYAVKEGKEQMFESFAQLKTETANAQSVQDLRTILSKSISILDEFNIVLR